jgi:hypothetical protein
VRCLAGSLEWIEQRIDSVLGRLPEECQLSLFEVTLFCLIEHIEFRPTVSLEPFPKLREFTRTFGARDSARRTPFRFDDPPPASSG